MSAETIVTAKGMKKIEAELEQLVKVEREEIKIAIAEARAHGDLKENAEYHSAKEKQGIIEGKILTLQGMLANTKVIDVSTIKQDKIVFGATVTLINTETEESVTYQIVGEHEANIKEGKISYTSPLGKSIIGKEVGDEVVVRAPKGDIEYEVEEFKYI